MPPVRLQAQCPGSDSTHEGGGGSASSASGSNSVLVPSPAASSAERAAAVALTARADRAAVLAAAAPASPGTSSMLTHAVTAFAAPRAPAGSGEQESSAVKAVLCKAAATTAPAVSFTAPVDVVRAGAAWPTVVPVAVRATARRVGRAHLMRSEVMASLWCGLGGEQGPSQS